MNSLPNPFEFNPPVVSVTFTLDEDRFLSDIEAAPLFISNPSGEYLTALALRPLVELLTKYQ